MTKAEFIAECMPYEEWKAKHDANIKKCFDEMKEYFDIDGFIRKYEGIKANRRVLETILYDAFENHNYQDYERDSEIARMLCTPLEDVMEFEKWDGEWKEIKNVWT